MLVAPKSSSHYYRAEGDKIIPAYEVPAKKGGMRKPTISDARENGYLVSISTVAGVLPKPALTAWLQSQAALAALTLPKLPDEPIDQFAKRVVDDMDSISRDAMDFGRRMHAQIEAELINPATPCPAELDPYMNHVREWNREHISRVISAEQVVGDVMLGIGGRMDLYAEVNMPGFPLAVLDYKTSALNGERPKYYKEWGVQLAGYGHCIKGKDQYEPWPLLISVVIDSKQPGPVHFKTWDGPEKLWGVFLSCLEIFCFVNDYDPRTTLQASK